MSAAPLCVEAATGDDAAAIAALEAACLPSPWSPAAVHAELAKATAAAWLARPGSAQPIAYACFSRLQGEAELLRVAVAPAARRRGVASALLAHALAALGRGGARVCHLEVRADNRAALALYRRLGFTVAGRRAGYYRDRSDALRMVLDPIPSEAAGDALWHP